MLSRRQFMLHSSSLISLSPLVPTMLCQAAQAAAAEADGKVLVVIQLDGGNDGINTVVPYGDDGYAKARVKLRLETRELHKLNDQVGLHPQMRSAKSLFDDGRLAIVQGVGYPNPDNSHFRSMRIWQTASMDDDAHNSYGWLGQALDRSAAERDSGEASAIYVGEDQTPVALWGRRSAATALSRLDDLTLTRGAGQAIAASPPNYRPRNPAPCNSSSRGKFYRPMPRPSNFAGKSWRQAESSVQISRQCTRRATGTDRTAPEERLAFAGVLHGPKRLRHARLAIANACRAARRAILGAEGVSRRSEGRQAGRPRPGAGVQRIRPSRRRKRLAGHRSRHGGPGAASRTRSQPRPARTHAEPDRSRCRRFEIVDRFSRSLCHGARQMARPAGSGFVDEFQGTVSFACDMTLAVSARWDSRFLRD